MNSKEFSLKIEGIVKEKKISHMDAVVWYCDENDLDTSQVSSLISPFEAALDKAVGLPGRLKLVGIVTVAPVFL